MSNGRRGASSAVARTLNGDGALASAPHTQVAQCVLCGGALRFDIGTIGETLEICDNRACPNNVPHAPIQQLDEPVTLAPHEMHMHGKQPNPGRPR